MRRAPTLDHHGFAIEIIGEDQNASLKIYPNDMVKFACKSRAKSAVVGLMTVVGGIDLVICDRDDNPVVSPC